MLWCISYHRFLPIHSQLEYRALWLWIAVNSVWSAYKLLTPFQEAVLYWVFLIKLMIFSIMEASDAGHLYLTYCMTAEVTTEQFEAFFFYLNLGEWANGFVQKSALHGTVWVYIDLQFQSVFRMGSSSLAVWSPGRYYPQTFSVMDSWQEVYSLTCKVPEVGRERTHPWSKMDWYNLSFCLLLL